MNELTLSYRIYPELEIPIYAQLVDMLRSDIAGGKLPAGTKLPTVRELSDVCNIARGTVMRAYDELEKQGLLEKIQGRGTFVTDSSDLSTAGRKEAAMVAIDTMLDTLEQLHFSRTETEIFLNLKLREREFGTRSIPVSVVTSCPEFLSPSAKQLRDCRDTDVYSFTAEQIREYPYRIPEETELVVTDEACYDGLKALLPRDNKIVRAATALKNSCRARLARMESGARAGIIYSGEEFARKLEYDVCELMPDAVLAPSIQESSFTEEYLLDKQFILLPEGYENFFGAKAREIIAKAEREINVIICSYEIDAGSMLRVRELLEELLKKE